MATRAPYPIKIVPTSLLEHRKRVLKLSQADVARHSSLRLDLIGDVENGRVPPAHQVNALCAAYHLTLVQFWKLFHSGREEMEGKAR